MKGYAVVLFLVLGLDIGGMAQTDVFFMYKNKFTYKGVGDEYEAILLPKQHGLDYNYYADNVSLESGCLLLLGLGLLYVVMENN